MHGTAGNVPGAWSAGAEPYRARGDGIAGSSVGFTCGLVDELKDQLMRSMSHEAPASGRSYWCGRGNWQASSCLVGLALEGACQSWASRRDNRPEERLGSRPCKLGMVLGLLG